MGIRMLKRLLIAAAILAGLTGAVHAAGTIPGISMTQQFDSLGKPLNGGKLYLIQAGTTATPQNCYQDSGLSLAWPNPITMDSAGRIPQLFCADGSIKVRLTDANGITQLVADNILIVGPSGGGGGGGSVDPTTIIQTGQIMSMYGTGALSGFVRANGRTIGSAISGATERANADTQALFVYLWGADANLTVSGGRGASAAADFAANKTITLPDFRGRVIAGLDDMGNTAAGRLISAYFGTGATTLGAAGGSQTHSLTLGELPTGITSSGSNSITVTSTVNTVNPNGTAMSPVGSGAGNYGFSSGTVPIIGQINSTGSNSISVTSNNTGGNAHSIVPPTILMTIYLKL